MTRKIAFLFPGQGSQYIGMGSELAQAFPEAQKVFERVDEVCKKPISKLCFDGPMDELTLTANLQPAVTAVSLACLVALNRSGIKPDVSAGHSLGEYAALVASGVLTGPDAVSLVNKRGELMHRESLEHPGAMAAVIGLSIGEVEQIVADIRENEVLGVANHNTAEQIVITGEKSPVSRAMAMAKEKGGKAIPLKVSGAWHCSLMDKAVGDFREFLEGFTFSEPKTSILFNATADEEKNPLKIKDIMASQLISPVRWYDIIQKMIEKGTNVFVEVGPKTVLSGLMKKIIPSHVEASVYSVQDIKTLDPLIEALG